MGKLLPWEDPLHDYRPVTGASDALAKSIENVALRESVFGPDHPINWPEQPGATQTALSNRIAAITENNLAGLLEKAIRVTGGAVARKQAIATRVIEPFKHSLISKGFYVDGERLTALHEGCERFVTQCLMAA
jgi:hypothetical protein